MRRAACLLPGSAMSKATSTHLWLSYFFSVLPFFSCFSELILRKWHKLRVLCHSKNLRKFFYIKSYPTIKDIPLEHPSPHLSPSQLCPQLLASHFTSEQFSAQFWTTVPAPLASKPQCPFSQCWLHFDVTVQFTREQFPRHVWVQSSPEHSIESHFPDRHRW